VCGAVVAAAAAATVAFLIGVIVIIIVVVIAIGGWQMSFMVVGIGGKVDDDVRQLGWFWVMMIVTYLFLWFSMMIWFRSVGIFG
jgi:hypothetical protein